MQRVDLLAVLHLSLLQCGPFDAMIPLVVGLVPLVGDLHVSVGVSFIVFGICYFT